MKWYTIVFFLPKLVMHWCTDMTSFSMQFEKRGRGLLWEAFRGEGECFVGRKTLMLTSIFQDRYFLFFPSFWPTKHSFSLWNASRYNPSPLFFKLDAKWHPVGASMLDQFPQKNNCILHVIYDTWHNAYYCEVWFRQWHLLWLVM